MTGKKEHKFEKYILLMDSTCDIYRFIECREAKAYLIDKKGVKYKKKFSPHWVAYRSIGSTMFSRKQYVYKADSEKGRDIVAKGQERTDFYHSEPEIAQSNGDGNE